MSQDANDRMKLNAFEKRERRRPGSGHSLSFLKRTRRISTTALAQVGSQCRYRYTGEVNTAVGRIVSWISKLLIAWYRSRRPAVREIAIGFVKVISFESGLTSRVSG